MSNDAEIVKSMAVKLLSVTPTEANRWYEEVVIPSLNMTAHKAVQAGHAAAVLQHLKRISDGGYA